MNYQELFKIFSQHESGNPKEHLTAYITFSGFGSGCQAVFNERSRTYVISSDNKAFKPNMGGYSIFGSCLDGTDPCVRLESCMADVHGGKDGWIVEDCCIVGWLLNTFNTWRDYPRELKSQQLYCTRMEASDVMLQELCRKGGLSYGELKARLQEARYGVDELNYSVNDQRALLSRDLTSGENAGNWSWDIQIVRIYSPLRILFSDIPKETAFPLSNPAGGGVPAI